MLFATQGVPVIFDTKLPDDVPGLSDLDGRRQSFKTIAGRIKSIPSSFVGDVDTGLSAIGVVSRESPNKDRTFAHHTALGEAAVSRESMVTDHPGLSFVRRSYPDGLHYFITNRGEQSVSDWVTLSATARSIEVMDPMTGDVGIAQTKTAADGKARIYLQLNPGESILLRTFTDTAATAPAWPVYSSEQ